MLFFNLECFQGTSFIFLYFPQPIKKSHHSSSKVLFWIADSLTFNLHHDTDLCLSNSLNPLVSVFGPLSCLPCLLNIKVFQTREYHLQDFSAPKTLGPHLHTNKVNGSFPGGISHYYNEKEFSMLKRQLG